MGNRGRRLDGGNSVGFRGSEEGRFWAKVNKSSDIFMVSDRTECWVWTAALTSGYGVFTLAGGKKHVRAHRWSFEKANGSILSGHEPDHLCRNPPCVRPSHLEAVTRQINILRGIGPAAQNQYKTHCPRGHQYNSSNIYGRWCKTCKHEADKGYYSTKGKRLRLQQKRTCSDTGNLSRQCTTCGRFIKRHDQRCRTAIPADSQPVT